LPSPASAEAPGSQSIAWLASSTCRRNDTPHRRASPTSERRRNGVPTRRLPTVRARVAAEASTFPHTARRPGSPRPKPRRSECAEGRRPCSSRAEAPLPPNGNRAANSFRRNGLSSPSAARAVPSRRNAKAASYDHPILSRCAEARRGRSGNPRFLRAAEAARRLREPIGSRERPRLQGFIPYEDPLSCRRLLGRATGA
jgi:hypothetical protein